MSTSLGHFPIPLPTSGVYASLAPNLNVSEAGVLEQEGITALCLPLLLGTAGLYDKLVMLTPLVPQHRPLGNFCEASIHNQTEMIERPAQTRALVSPIKASCPGRTTQLPNNSDIIYIHTDKLLLCL